MSWVSNDAAAEREAARQQFLTFKLDDEEYGIGILNVQEIRCWSPVISIPHQPEWVLGVLDLRGVIVPIIDLRRRFNLSPAKFGPATVVIVIRVSTGASDRTVGLVVDAVSEVYDVAQDALHDLPDVGSNAASEVVCGLAHTDGKTVILLDAMRLATQNC